MIRVPLVRFADGTIVCIICESSGSQCSLLGSVYIVAQCPQSQLHPSFQTYLHLTEVSLHFYCREVELCCGVV